MLWSRALLAARQGTASCCTVPVPSPLRPVLMLSASGSPDRRGTLLCGSKGTAVCAGGEERVRTLRDGHALPNCPRDASGDQQFAYGHGIMIRQAAVIQTCHYSSLASCC